MTSSRFCRTAVLPAIAVALAVPGGAEALSFGIHPTRQEFTLAPGQLKRYRFQIRTSGNRFPVEVTCRVADFAAAPDGSVEIVDAGKTAWSAAGWIRLARERVRVAPDRPALIPYEIRVPADARGGGYACIVVESRPSEAAIRQGAARVQVRVPYLVLVHARGTEVRAARVVRLATAERSAAAPLEISLTVRNSGNVLIRPAGDLVLTGDGEVGRGDVNPRRFAIMPGTERTFRIAFARPAGTPGDYRLVSTLDLGGGARLDAGAPLTLR